MVLCHRNIKGTIRNTVTDQEENKAVHCVCSYIIFCLIFTEINKKKASKAVQIGNKHVKVSLFVDSIILYIRDPKNSIRKQNKILLEMENINSKVIG